jgi:hypothetical protein
MITKILHRIRCFIYVIGKVFVIMLLPARRQHAPSGALDIGGPLT